MKIRYGCHSFMNAQPFIYPLVNRLVEHDFELLFDSPRTIAENLKNGECDIAFIPSIEYVSTDYLLIPDHSISSKGRVTSVLLFSKKVVENVKTIAVDSRSKTSVAMLEILLRGNYDICPELIVMEPEFEKMLDKCDAALIIGDNALRVKPEDKNLLIIDLGEEWYSLTGSVFVHAVLAVRPDVDLGNGVNTLLKAKEAGFANISKIAKEASSSFGFPYSLCLDYLKNIIRYNFKDEEISGLKKFYKLAVQNNIIGNDYEIRFY